MSVGVGNLEDQAPAFNVLVAEDSRANQMAIERMLSKHGAIVTVVADGSEAVDLVVTQGLRYKLAFFDINMPILGGVEALHRIREASIDMPVVAISASIDDEEMRRLTDAGFSMVTTKPLKISICRSILATYGHTPLDPSERLPVTQTPSSASSTRPRSTNPRDSARHDGIQTSVTGLLELSGQGESMAPRAGGGKSRNQHLVLVVEDNGRVKPQPASGVLLVHQSSTP